MIKQNFFDQLDGEWGDVIADVYKRHANKCFMMQEIKEKERYVVLKDDIDISLEKDNIIDDVLADCIFSVIDDYDKLIIKNSNIFKNTLYISIDSSYITNMYKDNDETNKFTTLLADIVDIAYISLNEKRYEIILFPLSSSSYIIRKYTGNDPNIKHDMRLNTISIIYSIKNDELKLDNLNANIKLDKKFFEDILDRTKNMNNTKLTENFKSLMDIIEEKTDFFD